MDVVSLEMLCSNLKLIEIMRVQSLVSIRMKLMEGVFVNCCQGNLGYGIADLMNRRQV